ncbi:uncharacterized protein LOC119594229 [Penaeus monodon]|uniref:uncharacterized protein LOC119594229 n=1 Tax=Penaeus monodon TaxID=6687 RepID=UPI0018A74E66|nr:uncharacterized protein LOC119594229 [Penaeus monodon]
MYSIILTTGYSSNLTAFLTVKRQPPSIETIKELRESRLNVFGVGPFFGNSMAQSENPHLRALAERFVSMSSFSDIAEQVLAGRGVMIQSGTFLQYMGDQLTTSRGLPRVRVIQSISGRVHCGKC